MIENGKVQTYTMLYVNYISVELKKLFFIKKKTKTPGNRKQAPVPLHRSLYPAVPGCSEEGNKVNQG